MALPFSINHLNIGMYMFLCLYIVYFASAETLGRGDGADVTGRVASEPRHSLSTFDGAWL